MLPSTSNCPWSSFRAANLVFCELDRCAWITQPANTWTNVGFLLVGALLLRQRARVGTMLGLIAIATGITSAAFHATGTLFGQLADQSTMFLESSLFVCLNLGRWRSMKRSTLVACYALLTIGSSALLLRFERLGIVLFITHVVAFLGIEARLYFRDGKNTHYRPLLSVFALFLVSYALWWVDRLGVVCDPQNHVFTAHGAWHLLGAASFWFWFRFYRQFAG